MWDPRRLTTYGPSRPVACYFRAKSWTRIRGVEVEPHAFLTSTLCERMVSYMFRPVYLQATSPWHSLDRPCWRSGHSDGEVKNTCPSKTRTPARDQPLYWLKYTGSSVSDAYFTVCVPSRSLSHLCTEACSANGFPCGIRLQYVV
jgi:hypothetical protein